VQPSVRPFPQHAEIGELDERLRAGPLLAGFGPGERLAFHGAAELVQLELKPVLLSNSVHLLLEYALEHAGIVCVPTLVASDAILDGRLLLMLPEHPLSSFWLSVFHPAQVRSALKLRLFLDLLAQSFAATPPWDAALIERGWLSAQIIE
jgi:DNA-binding transcriptional LysR family regulator